MGAQDIQGVKKRGDMLPGNSVALSARVQSDFSSPWDTVLKMGPCGFRVELFSTS